MSKLNVFVWNTCCSAGSGYGNTSLTTDIFSGICNSRLTADIIVLDEFYKFSDYEEFNQKLRNRGYFVIEDKRPPEKNVNQVLIAVSNQFEVIQPKDIDYPTECNQKKMPNYLRVTLKYNEKPFTIIGTRIRWNGHWNNEKKKCVITKETFIDRRNEFNELLHYVSAIQNNVGENILIAGDLNNAWDKISDWSINGDYNINIIEKESRKLGLKVHTPEKGYSIGEFRLDHLIIPKSYGTEDLSYCDQKGSDHAALVGTIVL